MNDTATDERFNLTSSPGFAAWLQTTGASVAFTTRQSGRLFFVGLGPDDKPMIFKRNFPGCTGLGLSVNGARLALATHHQLLRFDRLSLRAGAAGHDAIFTPRVAWITGDVAAHDVVMPPDGRPIFVNTAYSCVAQVSDGFSFRPLWRPPFISRLAPEDRCHLNGLALRDGRPRYVTLSAPSDDAGGWRQGRAEGGLLMDMETNETLLAGLSMPGSPRMHDGRLWLLNSGAGQLGWFDEAARGFQVVAFCAGYARGLALIGPYALVGVSMARGVSGFKGLPLERTLSGRGAEPRCGLLVIDTRSGETIEWIRMEGGVREIHDVAVLPGVRNPVAIGLMTDEVQRLITIDDG